MEEAPSAFSVYRLNADDVIKVDDKENPVCHGVVEKMSDKEIEIGLYHLEDSAFCSKFGSIHCDFETLEQKYDCEYVGKAADIRRADYKENIGIYAAFANHDIVHLEMPSEEKEEYPVQNANLKKFENLRIEYNEVEGERGFVLKGDTDRADDLILASYGEISPQQIYLEIKKYNLTVGDIEKQRISPFSEKPEKQSTDIPEQQSADISDNQSADTPENERATNSTINAVRLGDFYEIFGEEAKIAAEKLGLMLTTRNGEPMVGFPQHVLEENKNKLEAAGYSLKLWEDFREYTANRIISEKAESYNKIADNAPKDIIAEKATENITEEVKTETELHNFTITDTILGVGGQKTKYAQNIAAIKLLKQLEAEGRNATPDEQETLSKYVGWGGIPQAFDGNNDKWITEFAELKELLTEEEYAAAKGSTLNAHYTTPTVINAIYKALDNMGFKKGKVLDDAVA